MEWKEVSEENRKIIHGCYHETGLYRDMFYSTPKTQTLPKLFLQYAEQYRSLKVRPDDIWIVSHPKTGTTWSQEIIWLVMHQVNTEEASSVNLDDRFPFIDYPYILNFSKEESEAYFEKLDQLPSPRCIKTHLMFELLPPNLLDTCKVITCCRNIKDTVVSYYHHETLFNLHGLDCDFLKYARDVFRNNNYIWGGYWEMLESIQKRVGSNNLLFLWYDNMKKDQKNAITMIMKHLGIKLTPDQINKIDNYVRFDNYKQHSSMNKPDEYWIPGKGEFIRKGKVGDWRNFFSDDLAKEYDHWIKEKLGQLDICNPEIVGYFQLEH